MICELCRNKGAIEKKLVCSVPALEWRVSSLRQGPSLFGSPPHVGIYNSIPYITVTRIFVK